MKKLNKNEWVAVSASIGFLTYLFFSGPALELFGSAMNNQNDNNQIELPQSGVNVRDISLGTGPVAAAGDRLTVHYVGTLPSGRVFDSSRDRNAPIQFVLGVNQVIRGWEEGLKGMRAGGKRILVIAPDYGYGSQSVGTIPGDSTLIFEVELLNVEKPR